MSMCLRLHLTSFPGALLTVSRVQNALASLELVKHDVKLSNLGLPVTTNSKILRTGTPGAITQRHVCVPPAGPEH